MNKSKTEPKLQKAVGKDAAPPGTTLFQTSSGDIISTENPDLENKEVVAIIHTWRLSHLEGQVLTIVESLGLPESQEKAIKSLLRDSLWRWWEQSEHRLMKLRLVAGISEYNPKKGDLKEIEP